MATNTKKGGMDVKLNNLLTGIESDFPAGASITINQQAVDKAALTALVQNAVVPFDAVESTRNDLKQKVAARKAATPAAAQTYKEIVAALVAFYGTNTAPLADYGIAPRKQKRAMTPEAMLAAKLKLQKTRELRGTLGSRQKEKVKATGEVTISASLGDASGTNSTSSSSASSSPVNGSTAPATNGASAPAVNGSGSAAPPADGNGASH